MNPFIIMLLIVFVGLSLFMWQWFRDYKSPRQKRAFHKGLMTYEHGGSLKQTWRAIRDEQKRRL